MTPGVTVLLAAGRGGSPSRHARLRERLEEAGFPVVAPQAAMLSGPRPTRAELEDRLAVLEAAIAKIPDDQRIVGVGHSIGATLLCALAGATMWLGPGQPIDVRADPRLSRLVMLAPPLGYFAAPGSTSALHLPLMICMGGADTITPPRTARDFVANLPAASAAGLAVEPQAGHFSFMDIPPPGQEPAFAAEAQFRERLYDEIIAFAGAGSRR